MPRLRTLFSALALGVATALVAPSAALALETPEPPLLTAALGDTTLALDGVGGTVAVPESGTLVGVLRASATTDGELEPMLDVSLAAADGPGTATLTVGGRELTAGSGTAAAAAHGDTPIAVAFDAPGAYTLTIAASAEIASTVATPDAKGATLEATPVALSFEVAAPSVRSAAPAVAPADLPSASEPSIAADAPADPGSAVSRSYGVRDAAGARPIALTSGHIDLFEVTYDPAIEGLRMGVKDDTRLYDTETVFRDPAEVGLWLDSAHSAMATSGLPAAYAFLKSSPTIYYMPQTQDVAIPWPGWSTERLNGTLPEGVQLSTAADAVKLAIDIAGPGDVYTWMTGSLGGAVNRYIDTADPAPDVIPATSSAHVHTNWAFGALGDYDITVTPTATTTTGETITGPPAVYRIHVGPTTDATPVSKVAPAITGSGAVGETLALSTGAWSPSPQQTAIQWLRDGAAIAGATAAEYTPTAADATHSISALVTTTVGSASAAADAEPVTIHDAATEPGDPGSDPVVLEGGTLTVTPRFTAAEGTTGEIAAAPLGILDQTAASADDPWYSPDRSVIHLGAGAYDATTSTWKTADSTAAGDTQPALGFELAVHGADGSFLLGDYDQLNRDFFDDVFKAGVPQVQLVNASGPSEGAVTAATGVLALWDSTALLSGTEQTKKNVQIGNRTIPVFSFSQPGQYCLTFRETIPTNSAGTLTTMATYTVYVGDLPEIVAPCDQAGEYDGGTGSDAVTILDHGHTDLRVGVRDGKLVFGMGSSLVPLESVVLGGTPAPTTVPEPTIEADYGAIGEPGSTFWYFPATSTVDDNLWPGFSTESVSPGDVQSPLTFTLRGYSLNGVAEPAGSKIALEDGFSGSSLTRPAFDTSRGQTSFELETNIHSHPVWAFTQPGVYCVNLSASAIMRDGTRNAAEGLVTFVVGDGVDLSTVTPCERQYPDAATWPVLGQDEPDGAEAPGVAVFDAGSASWSGAITRLVPETDGTLDLRTTVKESGATERTTRDPEDLVISASRQLADGQYEVLPSALQFSTEALSGADVTWRLGDVAGPGRLTLSRLGTFRTVLDSSAADTSYPLAAPDRTTLVTWRFSAPGVYCVPIEFTVPGAAAPATATLTFAVGVGPAGLTTCSRGQHPTSPGDDGGDGNGGDNGGGGTGTSGWDVPNQSLTDSGAVILNNGHIDIASEIEADRLVTRIKDTTESSTPTYRDPAQTVLQLLPDSQLTVPDGSAYSFLGAPGSTIWQVSQTQVYGLLWPGWSTEEIPLDATQTGVTWTLDDISGPGEFALYETQLSDVDVLYNTRDGITAADSFEIAKNSHVHGSWAFGAEGTYCLAFTRSTILADGTPASDDFTLAVAVGEVDVKKVDPSQCFQETGKPAEADTTPVPEAQLTIATSGGVGVFDLAEGFHPGELVTAQVGASHADQWVSAWLHSTPTWLGWTQVSASGTIQVRLPADAPVGAHKLVVKTADGDLIGWDSLELTAASGGDGDRGTTPPAADPVFTAPAAQCTAIGTTVITAGHLDWNSQIVNGRLQSYVGDDSTGTRRYLEPSKTVLWLKPSSAATIPAGYGQIAGEGTTVWQVPQTQKSELIWLGWSTELLNAGNASSPVTWSLTGIDGPGAVKVYTVGPFGGVKDLVFDGTGSYQISLGVHAHANWAFSAQGVYRLHFTETVTLASGQRSSDSEVLTIAVGDVNPYAVGAGTGCGAATAALRTAGQIDADAAKEAAPQAQATAATPEVERGRDGGSGEGGLAADPISALRDGNPVPLLLTILGGLLLLGAIGSGVLWWRRRAAE